MQREESFPIPYIDVARATHTTVDVMHKAASMTIGASMDQEMFPILRRVSQSLLQRRKNFQTDIPGPGEMDETASNIQARSFVADIQAGREEKNGRAKKLPMGLECLLH